MGSIGGTLSSTQPLGTSWRALQAERARLDELEQSLLCRALAQSGGIVAHAARELGVARTTLSSRMEVLAIRPSRRGPSG
jgi:transcriptional regulator with GAF, ATPase, and Fis domain